MEVYTLVHRLCVVKVYLLTFFIPSSLHSLCAPAYICSRFNIAPKGHLPYYVLVLWGRSFKFLSRKTPSHLR